MSTLAAIGSIPTKTSMPSFSEKYEILWLSNYFPRFFMKFSIGYNKIPGLPNESLEFYKGTFLISSDSLLIVIMTFISSRRGCLPKCGSLISPEKECSVSWATGFPAVPTTSPLSDLWAKLVVTKDGCEFLGSFDVSDWSLMLSSYLPCILEENKLGGFAEILFFELKEFSLSVTFLATIDWDSASLRRTSLVDLGICWWMRYGTPRTLAPSLMFSLTLSPSKLFLKGRELSSFISDCPHSRTEAPIFYFSGFCF